MEIIYYIVMGIVQGIAEFLPISSSGHLALASSFFNFTADEAPAFDVLLHIGTLLAVFVVYRKDIFPLIPAFFSMMKKVFQKKFKLSFYDTNERMVIYIIIATLPLVLIALTGIEDKIELLKNYPMAIGGILIFNGIVLMVSDRLSNGSTNGENAKPKNAIIVGACQMLAILPGLSRSGSTITGGLLCNFDRQYAVKFSFILSIPAILGSAVMKIDDLVEASISTEQWLYYALGMAVAAIFGFLAMKVLIFISKKSNFTYFAYYCFAVGLAAIIYSAVR
ncbi:MAG: undecaprenyl-diphosphate phosphatase [Clostridia bacterium]|nr:undecaprenyl-diphosphate phosphatase [Clostridia bacterium]